MTPTLRQIVFALYIIFHLFLRLPTRIALELVASSSSLIALAVLIYCFLVEYTPQAYVASDLDMFFEKYSESQVGERPTFVSIDGGK